MTYAIGKKTYKLQRTLYEGFWAQVALSKSETKLTARIGKIQVHKFTIINRSIDYCYINCLVGQSTV